MSREKLKLSDEQATNVRAMVTELQNLYWMMMTAKKKTMMRAADFLSLKNKKL